jgi:hypothetical protein
MALKVIFGGSDRVMKRTQTDIRSGLGLCSSFVWIINTFFCWEKARVFPGEVLAGNVKIDCQI